MSWEVQTDGGWVVSSNPTAKSLMSYLQALEQQPSAQLETVSGLGQDFLLLASGRFSGCCVTLNSKAGTGSLLDMETNVQRAVRRSGGSNGSAASAQADGKADAKGDAKSGPSGASSAAVLASGAGVARRSEVKQGRWASAEMPQRVVASCLAFLSAKDHLCVAARVCFAWGATARSPLSWPRALALRADGYRRHNVPSPTQQRTLVEDWGCRPAEFRLTCSPHEPVKSQLYATALELWAGTLTSVTVHMVIGEPARRCMCCWLCWMSEVAVCVLCAS